MSAFPPANHSHRESCVQRPVPISRSSRRNSPLTGLSPPYNSWCFRKCSPRLFPTTLCSRTTSARSIAASVSRTASLALAPADPTTPLLLPSHVGICSPVVFCPEQVVIYSQAVLSTEQTRRPSTVSRRPSGSTHVLPRMCSQHTAHSPAVPLRGSGTHDCGVAPANQGADRAYAPGSFLKKALRRQLPARCLRFLHQRKSASAS